MTALTAADLTVLLLVGVAFFALATLASCVTAGRRPHPRPGMSERGERG